MRVGVIETVRENLLNVVVSQQVAQTVALVVREHRHEFLVTHLWSTYKVLGKDSLVRELAVALGDLDTLATLVVGIETLEIALFVSKVKLGRGGLLQLYTILSSTLIQEGKRRVHPG